MIVVVACSLAALSVAVSSRAQRTAPPRPIRWMLQARSVAGSPLVRYQLPDSSGFVELPGSSWHVEYGPVVREVHTAPRPRAPVLPDPHYRRVICSSGSTAVEVRWECDTTLNGRRVQGGSGGHPSLTLREPREAGLGRHDVVWLPAERARRPYRPPRPSRVAAKTSLAAVSTAWFNRTLMVRLHDSKCGVRILTTVPSDTAARRRSGLGWAAAVAFSSLLLLACGDPAGGTDGSACDDGGGCRSDAGPFDAGARLDAGLFDGGPVCLAPTEGEFGRVCAGGTGCSGSLECFQEVSMPPDGIGTPTAIPDPARPGESFSGRTSRCWRPGRGHRTGDRLGPGGAS